MNSSIYKNLLKNNLLCRGYIYSKKRLDKNHKIVEKSSGKKNIFKNKGFTLIELLIVIAIIGILSTLLMVNFIGVRQRARDTQRKANISQIQSALEEYRADQGNYPTSIPACGNSLTDSTGTTIYIQKIPCDPLGTGSSIYNSGSYYYSFNSSTNTYTLSACLENTSDSQGTSTSPGGSNCSSNFYYTVSNP